MARSIPYGSRSTADQVLAGIDLTGKRFLVTGCNSGLGFETMIAMTANGAHVIGLAKTLERAQEACEFAGPSTTPMACDLADFDSVAAATHAIRQTDEPLDAIVTSAMISNLPTLQTRYGVELQFLVNHIGHFALVNRLVDQVRNGSGRIVLVSGRDTRRDADGIAFDNLDGHEFYEPVSFYEQSKLAIGLYAKELSRRLAGRGIVVNSVQPPVTRGTPAYRNLRFPRRVLSAVTQLFGKSLAQGAATQTLLAASPRVAGITGECWSDCQITTGQPLVNDVGLAKRLWDFSAQIVAAHGPLKTPTLQVAA